MGAHCSFHLDVLCGMCWKPLIYAKDEDISCWWWCWSSLRICRLYSLHSLFLNVSIRQKGWPIPSVWTHAAENPPHFTAKLKLMSKEMRYVGLALKKCSIILSTRNDNSLFLQFATATVWWGFLQGYALQGPHLEMQGSRQTLKHKHEYWQFLDKNPFCHLSLPHTPAKRACNWLSCIMQSPTETVT